MVSLPAVRLSNLSNYLLRGNDESEAPRYILVMPVETGIQLGTDHREFGLQLPDQVEDRLRGNDRSGKSGLFTKASTLNLELGIRRGQRRSLNLEP